MKKKLKIVLWVILAILLIGLVLMALIPPPKHGPTQAELKQQLDLQLHKQVQRLYWHELLGLYNPPEEIFTPQGYTLLKSIQSRYSPLFLPYLVRGSAVVQQDVLWNPFFDMYILIENKDGLINSVVLASSLSGGQTKQRDIANGFWREIYARYQVALIANFANVKPYSDISYPIAHLQNLTNQYHWPVRIQVLKGKVPFDLYIQQKNQAIYCSPLEPGTYLVYNIISNKIHKTALALPPYTTLALQHSIQEKIDAGRAIPVKNQQEIPEKK